jgi:hypothetical protein
LNERKFNEYDFYPKREKTPPEGSSQSEKEIFFAKKFLFRSFRVKIILYKFSFVQPVEQARSAKRVGEEYARWQERVRTAKKLYANGVSIEIIAASLEQSIPEIQEMIDMTGEHYRKPFW